MMEMAALAAGGQLPEPDPQVLLEDRDLSVVASDSQETTPPVSKGRPRTGSQTRVVMSHEREKSRSPA